MGSHVESKAICSFTREIALRTSKGFLSAVNSHVSFQAVRSVTREAALVTSVTCLCIMMNPVDFELSGHLEFFLFYVGAIGNTDLE